MGIYWVLPVLFSPGHILWNTIVLCSAVVSVLSCFRLLEFLLLEAFFSCSVSSQLTVLFITGANYQLHI